MVTINGEHLRGALLSLGDEVEMTEKGTITATNGTQPLHGKAAHGAIEWTDRSLTSHVLERASSAKFRKRMREARS